MEHPSDQQAKCTSREAAKAILMRYSVLSFVTGFATGATVFAILCLNGAHAAYLMMERCAIAGTLDYTTDLETCPSTSSES